jgi:group I intron endonuclease
VHHSRHLQAAWNKYGEAEFSFELVATCEPEQLIEQEQFWIDAFQTADGKHGYNVSPTAGSPLGVKHTAETRAKISAVQLGKKATEETKARMSAARLAFLARPGMKEKAANAQREVMARPGMKERISAAIRQVYSRPGMRERQSAISRDALSRQEVREKLSMARRGRKLSGETRANMSVAQRKVWASSELREKQAAAQLGENNSYAKLTADDVREIRKLLAAGVLQKEIAKRFGVSKGAITDINRGKNWSHVK